MKPAIQILVPAILACLAQAASAQANCPQFDLTKHYGSFGPEDYRTFGDKGLVEGPHFPPEVEMLMRGKSGTLGGDIAYTLNVFPNHPRALLSAERLAQREKVPVPPGLKYTTQCYYERALQFQKNDYPVRMLYAMFLIKTKQNELARQHIEYVETNSLDAPFTQYNVGLLYIELGDNEKAMAAAQRAYDLGAANSLLKERLEAAGHWRPAAAASAASAATP